LEGWCKRRLLIHVEDWCFIVEERFTTEDCCFTVEELRFVVEERRFSAA